MKTADVAVIGAGIVGAACAYRLAERGLRVVILESASAPATGSTGRSAAGVRVQFTEAHNALLSWHSIQEYRDMPEAEYRDIGYLFLVSGDAWEAHLEGVRLQHRLGLPVEVLEVAVARQFVDFNPDGIAGATFGPADGVVNPHGITFTYLHRARALGAVLHTDSPLERALQTARGWQVQTPTDTFEVGTVINATGAWAGEVGARADLVIPVQPARRTVFVTGPLEQPRVQPLTVDLSSGFYFRSEGIHGERLIFGRSNTSDVGFHEGVDWDWLEPTLQTGWPRFPWLEHVTLDHRASWWGYYEVTPDHQPILGFMPDAPGWVNACGFSGHGVQQAAAVGRVITQMVVGEQPFIDVQALRFERFSAGKLETERLVI
jgi:sarcosine oxidase subunit beta